MNKLTQNLNEILNVEYAPETRLPEVLPPTREDDTDLVDDFTVARRNIRELLRQGDTALEGILDLARSGEHPRSYEVAGQIIKTLVDANKDLLSIHKQVKDLRGGEKAEGSGPTNVTNAVFVGTTAELLELAKKTK